MRILLCRHVTGRNPDLNLTPNMLYGQNSLSWCWRYNEVLLYMVKGGYLNSFWDIEAFYEVKSVGYARARTRGLLSIFYNLLIWFDLILYVPSTIFQLNRDESSWVEPVLS